MISLTNPLADAYFVLDKVYGGGKYLKQSLAETPIEPINSARTTKICYGVLEKDVYLDYIIGSNCERAPKRSIKLILKIALYLLEFMSKHDYMVVDNAVELAKKLGKTGASGFINGFLRSYKIPKLPQKADDALSVTASAPLWLAKKLRRSYKSEAFDVLSTPSKGLCVRFERNAENYLDREHIKTPFDGAYIFPNFVRDSGFFEGDYTFQSVGSIAICSAISPCERLLDACAAPGGKSVLLSKKCKKVTAQELHGHRVELIKSYAERMGAENIAAVCADATVFNEAYSGCFDSVLCDAPCSGTGVINENPDIKLFRRESDIASLTELQLKILQNCAKYVKSGGYLYYSTCSVLPEENDSVVYNFLQSNDEFEIEWAVCPLEHRKTRFGLQFLPHISMGAGFYFCKMKKV